MRLFKWLLCVAAFFCTSVMGASMTDSQLQALAVAIRSDADASVVAALAVRNDTALASIYNTASTFTVWRTSVPVSEYREAIVWTEVDGLAVGKARIWEWLTQNNTLPIDASKVNVRQGIADCWAANSSTRTALLELGKRMASRAERLFVSGTGTSATPGLLGWEGPLQVNDVSNALNRF